MLCEFGCGQEAKFQTVYNSKWKCAKSSNSCPVNKKKNAAGIHKAIAEGRLKYDFYDSLDQETKNRMTPHKGIFKPDFCLNGKGQHKKALLKERGHICEKCLNHEWLGQPITLELEHVDGNNKNNIKENLLLLCPNCHSQTPTWRRSKSKTGVRKNSDEEIKYAVITSTSMRATLLKLNLKWSSNISIRKIMNKYNLNFARACE